MSKEWNYTLTASRLRQLREKKGYTFERLSQALKKCGTQVSVDSLKVYEVDEEVPKVGNPINGRAGKIRGMKIDTLIGLAKFYDVSTDYLFGRTDNPSPNYNKQVVSNTTGLDIKAIDGIQRATDDKNSERLSTLNAIISSPEFIDICLFITEAREQATRSTLKKDELKELNRKSQDIFIANGNGYHEHLVLTQNDGISFKLYLASLRFDKLIHRIIGGDK